METIYTGITSGKTQHPELIRDALRKFEGKRVKITIEQSDKRTLDQNSLIWKYCEIAGKDLGYTKNELYYEMECQINGEYEKEIMGKIRRLPKEKFKDMAKMDAMWYIGEFQRIIAEQGIVLPDPQEYYESLD